MLLALSSRERWQTNLGCARCKLVQVAARSHIGRELSGFPQFDRSVSYIEKHRLFGHEDRDLLHRGGSPLWSLRGCLQHIEHPGAVGAVQRLGGKSTGNPAAWAAPGLPQVMVWRSKHCNASMSEGQG